MSRKESKREAIALDLKVRKVRNSLTNQNEEVRELHPRWKEMVQFVCYTPLAFQLLHGNKQPVITDDATLEEWKERATFINEDLKWLLCLPHDKFWCQVIFDESLHACLESYLKHAPRTFDLWHLTLPDELVELQHNINKRIFMVFLRMSTHKESKECFFTPSTFGDIIYENYLFDIPKLMDICAVYGGSDQDKNIPLLRKMIENIFDKQPKYYDDLEETIPTLLESLNNILTKCGLENTSDNSPQKLSEKRSSANELGQQEVIDMVLYLSDIGHTLVYFMEIFPPSCQYFFKQGLVSRLASFFEIIIPFLESKLSSKEMKFVRPKLEKVIITLVQVCNIVLKTSCIEPSASSDQEDVQRHIEDFCQVLMSILSEKRFVSWYDAHYSIENDLITIQSCPGSTLDTARVDYIVQAIHSAHDAFPNKTKKKGKRNKKALDKVTSNDKFSEVNGFVEEPVTSRGTAEDESIQGASLSRHDVDDIQLASMVTSVRDLLPGLGEGFVMKCLQEYNYDFEKVINAVLENNLTDSLNKLDRSMDKAQALDSVNKSKTILSTRHSVYDKDEFDVFTQGSKIDLSRVHKGKKRDMTTLDSLLGDKSHMTEAVKDRFNRYDVYGKLNKEPAVFDEYNDEYDDTYDSIDVGAQDDDSADELTTRRPFTIPRVLGKTTEESSSSDEDDDNNEVEKGEPDQNEKKPSEDQNRWRTPDKRPGNKGFYRGGYANRGRGGYGQGRGSEAVNKGQKGGQGKGKAKGPPDPATLRSRAMKERNKSQRANHNRKIGADRKRNKGMGPLPPQ